MMHYHNWLGQRYRLILGYTGSIWIVIGLLILSPLLALPFIWAEHPQSPAFAIPGLALIILGALLLWQLPRRQASTLTLAEGSVIVVFTWLTAVFVGALPLMSLAHLNFSQAIFEATSGWTTTGLSVIDVESASRLVLLYRSIMQLAGGAGLAIIMLTALTGPVGMGLSTAEGRGDQLAPHVRQSAAIVLELYSGYVVAGILALRLAGMNWFDAINHAFAALSTGGFSTHADSIGYFDSPAIEAVTIVLMLLGTINFLTSYAAVKGRWRVLLRNSEMHVLTFLLALSIPTLLFGVTWGLTPTVGKALRVALFEAVSALSTTGFTTVSYLPWPSLGWLVIIGLMLIGGGSGSTAGGIKQSRIYVLTKAMLAEIRRPLLPRNTILEVSLWQGEEKRFLSSQHIRTEALFVFLYLTLFSLGAGVLTAYGFSLRDSLFEYASAISTIGLSVGVTSPHAPAGVLWTLSAGMFLGRLEFFAIFTGLAKLWVDGRSFWASTTDPWRK